jgi:hypothetical protein
LILRARARRAAARRWRARRARRRSALVGRALAAVVVVGVCSVTVLVAVVAVGGVMAVVSAGQVGRGVVVAEVDLGGQRDGGGEQRHQGEQAQQQRPAPARLADLEQHPLARQRLEQVGHRRHAGEGECPRRAAARIRRRLGVAEGGDELLERGAAVGRAPAPHPPRDAVCDFEVADGDGLRLGHGCRERRKNGPLSVS